MPRPSSAALMMPAVDGGPARIESPPGLDHKTAAVFRRVVESTPRGHLVASDAPLVVEYCRAVLLGERADRELRRRGPAAAFCPDPPGPVMWNRMRGALSRFLTMETGDKYDPFRRSVMGKLPKADEGEGRVPDITPQRFWEILERVPEPMRPIYVLMVGTGVEPGVMPKATLARERQALVVEGAKKGRQGVTVIPLSPELWAYAKRAVPCSFTRDYLYRTWKAACVAAGSRELRLYDLRHCFGQWLINAGVAESVVQVGMRHKTAGMTRRYVKQKDRGTNATVMASVLFGSPAETPAGGGPLKLASGA